MVFRVGTKEDNIHLLFHIQPLFKLNIFFISVECMLKENVPSNADPQITKIGNIAEENLFF